MPEESYITNYIFVPRVSLWDRISTLSTIELAVWLLLARERDAKYALRLILHELNRRDRSGVAMVPSLN